MIADFLHDLPKCEHHVHLEGTLEPALLFRLAERNGVTLPAFFPASAEACSQRYAQFANLQDFLDHYYVGMSVLVQENDFYELAMMYFERAHHENCLHSEVFFDPQGHLERGIGLETVVAGFSRACAEATTRFGTSNKLIMCLLRHLSPENCLDTVKQAEKYYDQGIIHGLGLDSSEVPNHPEKFHASYSAIREKYPHVGLTAHAGEEGDHTYVSKSLDVLNVSRIDHGVNSHQDEGLMDRLVREQILLSMCPMSNLKLQVVDSIAKLPIKKFLDRGIPFSINSDDPAYFGGYILDNYRQVHEHFGFTVHDWKKVSLNSINGSWCDEARKVELRNILDDVMCKYQHLH